MPGEDVPVTTRMLQCVPILEAYGNAAMPRNDDSSRFGKFFKVLAVSGQAMKTDQGRSVSIRARIVARVESETICRLEKIVLE